MIEIRCTEISDLGEVMSIYGYAREFMRSVGNETQWIDGYPSEELIRREIEENHSWVCIDDCGEIVGTFCFILGEDPTYAKIYDGEWLNNEPYGVIHRMGTNGKQKGIAEACLNWCFSRCKNIRVDTHRDNLVMQNILKKHGFTSCGTIFIANGTERIAFQKKIL